MEWYERIKERRHELNLSQQELAERLGYLSRSSINKIEQGINDIPQSKIIEFASALKTTPMWIMFGYSYELQEDKTILNLYNKLDEEDKAEIRGEIKQMLKADKYTKRYNPSIDYIAPPLEIAAWGADGTEAEYRLPVEETT